MKQLTKEQGIALIRWYESFGQNNWGGWHNYPSLPVGASYLQYDDNKCQVNLSETIIIDDEKINCISASRRSIGNKWYKVMTFSGLKSWCLPEEVKEQEAAAKAERVSALSAAKENFAKLPENIQSELMALTVETCGSNNRRKKMQNAYIVEHAEAVKPFFPEFKHLRYLMDCLQYNHDYYPVV